MSTLTINMNPREAQCAVCGEWTDYHWGLPTYNGDLVSNGFPEDLHRSGGSVACCESCFGKHERGELDTFDNHYVGKGFVQGAGI